MGLIIALFFIGVIYILQFNIYKKHWSDNLSISLTFDKNYVNSGEDVCLNEVINNHKFLPLCVLNVKFKTPCSFIFQDSSNSTKSDFNYRNDAFSLLSHQRITRKLIFRATKRGYYNLDIADIVTYDFFHIHTFASRLSNDTVLYVFPNQLHDISCNNIINHTVGEIALNHSLIEDPFEFRCIRDFMPGDNYKNINWKAYAKNSVLMTNTYNSVTVTKVLIVLNLDTTSLFNAENLQEYMISLTSTLSKALISNNMGVSLYSNATDSNSNSFESTGFNNTLEQLNEINKFLSTIDTSTSRQNLIDMIKKNTSSLFQKGNGIHYVFVSNYRRQDMIEMYKKLCVNGNSTWLIPEYRGGNLNINLPGIKRLEVF